MPLVTDIMIYLSVELVNDEYGQRQNKPRRQVSLWNHHLNVWLFCLCSSRTFGARGALYGSWKFTWITLSSLCIWYIIYHFNECWLCSADILRWILVNEVLYRMQLVWNKQIKVCNFLINRFVFLVYFAIFWILAILLCRPCSRPFVLQLLIWSTLGCNKFQDCLGNYRTCILLELLGHFLVHKY